MNLFSSREKMLFVSSKSFLRGGDLRMCGHVFLCSCLQVVPPYLLERESEERARLLGGLL